jgi:Protein of unknown function (DUF4246)
VAAVDGTWQSDTLFSEELRQALLQEVSRLENVPEHAKDWHPGSNNQVLDLVHPSLFCYVAGVTHETETPAHPPLKYINSGKVFILFLHFFHIFLPLLSCSYLQFQPSAFQSDRNSFLHEVGNVPMATS